MIRPLTLLLLAPVSAFAANCDGVAGDWKWFNGSTVTLTQQKTVLKNGKPEGKWTCSDPTKNIVVVTWNGGFVDNLTLAANRLTGKNQQGATITADRKTAVAHK
jgi:hypothetical protein